MSAASNRVDVWLFRTRFFKTRSDANGYVGKKGLRITRDGQTRRTDRPGASVSMGDVLTFGRKDRIIQLEVLGLPERRGPATEARTFYRLLEDEAD